MPEFDPQMVLYLFNPSGDFKCDRQVLGRAKKSVTACS